MLVLPRPQATKTTTAAPPALPRPPPPQDLQKALETIAKDFGEPVGLAVADVTDSWVASVNGQGSFPQQSVSKTWVAVTVLDAVDRGRLSLATPVVMTPADQSVFSQAPMGKRMPPEGIATDVETLIRHAIVNSDNSANDTLMRVVGLDAIRTTLEAKRLSGIKVGADERRLQAMIAGLAWDPSYSQGRQFQHARSRLSEADRQAAQLRYLIDPADGATPEAIAVGLARLKRGELLSVSSTRFMLETMSKVRTGRSRLKGGLPKGWTIGHKTGTGQDLSGSTIGINDVGVLTAPDGHSYSVAVMIARTEKPGRERIKLMHDVVAAVVDHWESARQLASVDNAKRL
jgi:beta-lactamase class A